MYIKTKNKNKKAKLEIKIRIISPGSYKKECKRVKFTRLSLGKSRAEIKILLKII